MCAKYKMPKPIIDEKEENSLNVLTEKFNKLIKPNIISKISAKAGEIIPQKIKELGTGVGNNIAEQEIYIQMMKYVGEGFNAIEEQAAKHSLTDEQIINKINKKLECQIRELDEICLLRSYEIESVISAYKTQDIFTAAIEGSLTGGLGFAGLPLNIVFSTFLYFRAVQSIAMFYGYDVKNDSSELIIASEVFKSALNPIDNPLENETAIVIGKIMVITQAEIVKQMASKTWFENASRNGIPLLITQIRALANNAAKKALDNAGKKGLENKIFSDVLEQLVKKVTKESLTKVSVGFSAIFGALVDSVQMRKVLDYADIFYQKRFIIEKEARVVAFVKRKRWWIFYKIKNFFEINR